MQGLHEGGGKNGARDRGKQQLLERRHCGGGGKPQSNGDVSAPLLEGDVKKYIAE